MLVVDLYISMSVNSGMLLSKILLCSSCPTCEQIGLKCSFLGKESWGLALDCLDAGMHWEARQFDGDTGRPMMHTGLCLVVAGK